MKIVFFGSGNLAIPSLNLLLKEKEIEIVTVVTKPDKKKGRGLKIVPLELKKVALKNNLRVYQPEKINVLEVVSHIKSLTPEIIVVVAYGRILPLGIIQIPSLGCVNLHPSLLPELKGPSAIPYSIIRGYTHAGVTTIYLNEKIDGGDILFQKKVKIDPNDTSGTLSEKLAKEGAELLFFTLKELKRKRVTPTPQDERGATYAPFLSKKDGLIDWRKSAEEINNLVRGLNPWPSAYTYLQSKMIKIHRSSVEEKTPLGKPGEVVELTKEKLSIATGRGILSILELQPENKRKMNIKEFLAGHKLEKGTRFSSLPHNV